MKKLNNFGAIERLTRAEMRNVTGGLVQPGGPGDCVDACGGSTGKSCANTNQPYCLITSCTNKDGKKVDVYGCSPTVPQ